MNLRIDDTHTYWLGDDTLPSVSSIVSRFYEPFNSQKIAHFVARKREVSKEEILYTWKKNADLGIYKGNYVHNLAEDIVTSTSFQFPQVNALFRFIADFFDDTVEVIACEKMMFSNTYKYAGTVDLYVKRKMTRNKFKERTYIIDWKTNDNIRKYYGKKMFKPFERFDDTPLSHYFVQQNLYKLMMEENGYPVDEMLIVWLKDKQYEIIQVPDLREELIKYFNEYNS